MNKKDVETPAGKDPLFHDTWKLLQKYRDVVWNLELSVQHLKKSFEIEFSTGADEFLDTIYHAGLGLEGSRFSNHAKCIEQSNKMIKMLESAVELLRAKHKNGETYYWVLYYTYLSPQEQKDVEEIIISLQPHIRDISSSTYYRRRREAVEALGAVLWGYTARDTAEILEEFFAEG